MAESPWGPLRVADAHVHFFSHGFFNKLAVQKGVEDASAVGALLQWEVPSSDAAQLADTWAAELDKNGVTHAAIIASIPGDEQSVVAAVTQRPQHFFGYFMVDPLQPDAKERVAKALSEGALRGICLFPAMHCFSIADPRVKPILELAADHRAVVFVHSGVLSVGFRKKLNLPSLFDMRYSNPIDLHPVAIHFPQIRFVIPHFGAGYFRETLMLADLCRNVYIDTSSSNHWMAYEELDLRAVFRRTLDVAGPSRILFGTDSSYFPRGWNAAIFEQQAKALYELGLDAEQAQPIFFDNLVELFTTR